MARTRQHSAKTRDNYVAMRRKRKPDSDALQFDKAYINAPLTSPDGALIGALMLTTIIGQDLAGKALKGPLQERLPMLFPSENGDAAPEPE